MRFVVEEVFGGAGTKSTATLLILFLTTLTVAFRPIRRKGAVFRSLEEEEPEKPKTVRTVSESILI